jgi:hypothetical protein
LNQHLLCVEPTFISIDLCHFPRKYEKQGDREDELDIPPLRSDSAVVSPAAVVAPAQRTRVVWMGGLLPLHVNIKILIELHWHDAASACHSTPPFKLALRVEQQQWLLLLHTLLHAGCVEERRAACTCECRDVLFENGNAHLGPH